MLDLGINRSTAFLTWGLGFGATRHKDKKSYKRSTSAYCNIVPNCGAIGQFLEILDSSPIHTKTRVNKGAKRQEDCGLLALSAKILLASQVEKQVKYHVYPHNQGASQQPIAQRVYSSDLPSTRQSASECVRVRQTLKTHRTHRDTRFLSTSRDA